MLLLEWWNIWRFPVSRLFLTFTQISLLLLLFQSFPTFTPPNVSPITFFSWCTLGCVGRLLTSGSLRKAILPSFLLLLHIRASLGKTYIFMGTRFFRQAVKQEIESYGYNAWVMMVVCPLLFYVYIHNLNEISSFIIISAVVCLGGNVVYFCGKVSVYPEWRPGVNGFVGDEISKENK